jgi:hypothetical protein
VGNLDSTHSDVQIAPKITFSLELSVFLFAQSAKIRLD